MTASPLNPLRGWRLTLWGAELHVVPAEEYGEHAIGCGQVCSCDPLWADFPGIEMVLVHMPGVIAWKGATVPERLPKDLP